MNDSTALIWLSSIPALSDKSLGKLLEAFPEPGVLWDEPNLAMRVLGTKSMEALREAKSEDYLDALLCALEEKDVRVLTLFDDDYPDRLRAIEEAPPVLYLRGCLPEKARAAAIVGTRKCTADGRVTAQRMA